MKKTSLYLFAIIVSLSSCSSFHKLLKSSDNELKYAKAKEFHAKGDFMRAARLLEDIAPFFKGTPEAGNIVFLLADSYFQNRDYLTAINYFKSYNNTFPRGEHIMESRFMLGYAYYLLSPDPRLDQNETYGAINAFNTYIELFPHSERAPEASRLAHEMFEKLAYKELLNARLYFRLGNYMGNNYLSAIIVSQNALKKHTETQYREEFMFLILRSKYMQAVRSIASKRADRFRETVDEFYVYSSEFPNGRFIRDAERMFAEAKRHVAN